MYARAKVGTGRSGSERQILLRVWTSPDDKTWWDREAKAGSALASRSDRAPVWWLWSPGAAGWQGGAGHRREDRHRLLERVHRAGRQDDGEAGPGLPGGESGRAGPDADHPVGDVLRQADAVAGVWRGAGGVHRARRAAAGVCPV